MKPIKIKRSEPMGRDQFNRFSAVSNIYGGYDVIDDRGRIVKEYGSFKSANGAAYKLNCAAANGPEELLKALGYTPA